MISRISFTLLLFLFIGMAHISFAQSKFHYFTDKTERLYKLMEVKVNAEKFYSYKNCFEMSGDTIKGVKDAEADAYLAYIKSVDVFSDDYLSKEKRWFANIKKEIAKKGFSLEKIRDKYYGENAEAVREELLLRQNERGYSFSRYWSSSKMGGHGVFKSTFTKAGYDMKINATLVGEDWYIDGIKQGKDRD
jgi:hypothetical protein